MHEAQREITNLRCDGGFRRSLLFKCHRLCHTRGTIGRYSLDSCGDCLFKGRAWHERVHEIAVQRIRRTLQEGERHGALDFPVLETNNR